MPPPVEIESTNRQNGSLDLDFNVVSVDANRVTLDIRSCGRVGQCTRLDVEARTMPRADDFFSYYPALGQRAANMGTSIVDGLDLSVEVEDGNFSTLRFNQLTAFETQQLGFTTDFRELAH